MYYWEIGFKALSAIAIRQLKKIYTVCLVRQKAIKLTPEEAIRQLYLRVLRDRLHYPLSRIQVEYGVNFRREVKRADIVVMDKDRPNTVYILVELKKPKLNIKTKI
ncbi:type I restriction enzyme HsdR N-terminal domain-containing protein [Nostoc parmelioides]|uniref:Type I restriction enzyme HsdR N-terminal domain-containing protein n=1 Tax=Nostoc parmelioides FACHB-3921 TaxID=2692909 RepID=A0ABR8BJI0_9NOSO|nr:type I restriction enzyme HsdR N-terminal domain-containing protein [Nostoc parmelioides]MBD2254075.1 type I restriction enzyme HsdR N-terminal domain-containing protein [Nostoc parmelioides FACHB-3921]